MEYSAVIVHSDQAQRATLRQYLDTMATLKFQEFDNTDVALNALKNSSDKVDFVFLAGDTNSFLSNTVALFREVPAAENALVFVITSPEDHQWVKTIFGLGDLIDNILIKPFRPETFIQRIQHLLKADLSKKSCVLVVEDNDEAREVIRDYLNHFGFPKVYEATDGQQGLDMLNQRSHEIAIVISDWEMPSMNGIQLLRRMRETPALSSIPFVMVTSQTSIEQIKAIQAAELGVNGYLLKPFELKTFRAHMENVFQDVGRQRESNSYLISGRTFLAQNNPKAAVERLVEGTQVYPNIPALWEALGDAYCQGAPSGEAGKSQLVQAVEAYEKAIKLSPLKTQAVMKCFDVLSSLERMNDAVKLLKSHLHHAGFDDGLRTRLAKIYLQNGDYPAACVELRRALNINPNNSEAQSLMQVAGALNAPQPKKKTA